MYNPNTDDYRPQALRRFRNEVQTSAANQQKTMDFADVDHTAHCMLDALRNAKQADAQGLLTAAASGSVPETDPIALAAAQAAADFGVTIQ